MTPVDMLKTIAAKSDQLNADDLIGRTLTITITAVKGREEADQPVAFNFEGDDRKPYLPCKSMRRVIVQAWGEIAAEYVGRRMTLYRDENVQFGGMKVGGIRISHMSHIERERVFVLSTKRGQKAPYSVKPLRAPVADLGEARRPPPREQVPAADDDGGFPGDRPNVAAYDPAAWADEQHRLLETFRSVAEIDDHTANPDLAEAFGRLQEAAPGLANSLNAAFKGRRKALASREREGG